MWALARPFREIPDSFEYSVCGYLSQQFRFYPHPDPFRSAVAGGAFQTSKMSEQDRCGFRFEEVSVI